MSASSWEYCALILFALEIRNKKIRCQLGIRYFGADSRMLARIKGEGARDWESNPWEEAVAQLGAGGWELVSVQHANAAGDMGAGGELSNTNAIAYFKRPSEPRRAIDEPALELGSERL